MAVRGQMLTSMVASAERLHPNGFVVDPKEKSADKDSGEPLLLDRPAWASNGFINRKHVEDWKDRNVGIIFRSLKESSASQESEQIAGFSP